MGHQAGPGDPMFISTKGVPVRVARATIHKRLAHVARESGLRDGNGENRRHNVPLMNGFRRFFNKTTKDAPTPDTEGARIRTEYMMGHRGMGSLDRNYFKTDVLELATAYVLAVPDLTMDDADRLRLSNRRLADSVKRMEGEKDAKMERMERELVELRRSRVPPGMDLVEALKGAAGADGVPGTVVESLTGMMRQLAESQEVAMREMWERQEATNREMQAKHDAEMRELRRALERGRRDP